MKKRIALLFIGICLLCQTAVFAAEDDKISRREKICGIFDALGIQAEVEGESVTRGEFIIALMGMAGFDLTVETDTGYADIAAENTALCAAVSAASVNNIIAPAQNFYPDRAVSYDEAAKMAVCALGYEYSVDKNQGTAGYAARAAALGIMKNVGASGTLDANDFYTLLYNLTTVKAAEAKTVSTGDMSIKRERTILEIGHDVYEVKGIVTADEYSYLSDAADALGEGRIMVGDDLYDSKITAPLGFYIEGYAKRNNDGNDILIYADSSRNSVVKLRSDAGIVHSDGRIKTSPRDGAAKTYNIGKNAAVIYNGKAYRGALADIFSDGDGSIELVKRHGDTEYSLIVINESKFMTVASVDMISRRIFDKKHINSIDLSDSTAKLFVNGTAGGIESIRTGDCIEYYLSEDGELCRINVLGIGLSGKSEAVDEDFLTVDGETYAMSRYFKSVYLPSLSMGVETDFYLSSDGLLVYASKPLSDDYIYGYVLRIFEDTENQTVKLKLYSENEEVNTCELSEKLVLNGTAIDEDDRYYVLATVNKIAEKLVRFKLDAEGKKIKRINTDSTPDNFEVLSGDAQNYFFKTDTVLGNEKDGILKRYRYETNLSNTTYFKDSGYFVPYFTIDGTTKIFCVIDKAYESDSDKRVYMGDGVYFIENDASVTVGDLYAYNVNRAGHADAIVYKTTSRGKKLSYDSAYGVVAKVISECIAPDGENAMRLDIYAGDSFRTYYMRRDEGFFKDITKKANGEYYTKGDLVRFAADSSGYICSAPIIDFDANAGKVLNSGQDNSSIHYAYGKLYDYDDSSFTLIDEKDGKIKCYQGRIENCGFVSEDGEVSTAYGGKLVTYLQSGEKCCRLLIKCSSSRVKQFVVYE